MGIFDLFNPNACNIEGRNNTASAWTWDEYRKQKEVLKEKLVLVDMIRHPILDSVPISDEMFAGAYPEGTTFALYCHSGGSSGYLQMQLAPKMRQFTFINMKGGIMSFKRGF